MDLINGGRFRPRPLTPTSPLTADRWGLDGFIGSDGVNPAFIHSEQPHSRLNALDLESKKTSFNRKISTFASERHQVVFESTPQILIHTSKDFDNIQLNSLLRTKKSSKCKLTNKILKMITINISKNRRYVQNIDSCRIFIKLIDLS